MNQFPYLYPHSLSEAERLNEEELWQDVETVGRAYWHGAKSMVSVVKHITSGKNGCLVWARQQ